MRPQRALVALLLLLSLGPAPALAQVPLDENVLAIGDAALRALAEARGFDGAGSAADPIVIEGLSLSANGAHGIELRETTLHVRIREVNVTSTTGGYDGIRVVAASNVVVERVEIQGARYGVAVERSTDVRVHNSTISASGDGVFLDRATLVTVEDNALLVNARALHLRGSEDNTMRGNAIAAAGGQLGLHVDDATSWRNRVTTTNTVNDVPLQWHYDLHGTPARPVVLANVTANVLGLTNVGQIVVVASSHVVVEGAHAANGPQAGLVVRDSDRVSVRNTTIELNVVGIDLRGGSGHVVESSNASGNGIGVRLDASDGARIVNATLARNSQTGVRAIESANLAIQGSRIHDNGVGVLLSESPDANLTANEVARNGGAGIRVDEAPRLLVENNSIVENAPGIHFSAGTGATLRSNAFTAKLDSYALQFGGVDTYAQTIPTSNRVDGDAIQWHRGLQGEPDAPVVIEDVRVSARGVSNVAQILVQDALNVVLRNVTAHNGSAAGILVHGGSAVTIEGANVSGNVKEGILVEGGRGHAIIDANATRNGREGILLTETAAARVDASRMTNNSGDGLRATEQSSATLADLELSGNGRSGLAMERASEMRVSNLTAERNARHGVSIVESHRGRYENLTIRSNGAEGVRVQVQSAGNLLRNGTIVDNQRAGVSLDQAGAGNVLWNLTVAGQVDGVRIAQTTNTELLANNVTALPEGYGLSFRDGDSHATHVPANNTVNGESIPWFSRVSGTPERPLVIRDLVVSTPRMTNLAQVVVTRASHVIVENVTASNGVAGLLVSGSSNVTIRNVTASDGDVGIHVEGSQRVTLLGSDAPRNKIGVKLTGTVHSVVANTSAAGAATAVELDASTLNEVSGTRSEGVLRQTVEDLTGREGAPGHNLVADAGLELEGTPGKNVTFAKAVATAADDAMTSFTWNFGDGTNETFPPGASARVAHAYVSEGLFVATLAVHTESGRAIVDTVEVLVELPLGPPRALTARERDATIALSWTPGVGGNGLVHHVYRGVDDDDMQRIASTTAPEFRDTTAEPGVTYLYQVSAERRDVEGPRSNVASAAHSVVESDDSTRIFGLSLPLLGGIASLLLVAAVVVVLIRRRKKEEV